MSSVLPIKKVAAVAIAVAMIFGAYFAVSTVKAEALTEAQISSILSLLSSFGADQTTIDNVESSLRGETPSGGSGSGSSGDGLCGVTFTQNFDVGDSGAEVKQVQMFLNTDADTRVAASGVGSAGNETEYFGSLTAAAVTKFQNKYAADVLAPVGLSAGTGYWGPSSRAKANALNAAACDNGDGGTTPPPATGGGVSVSAASQPSNTLAPESASRVPFTKVTLTAGNSNVTVNSITVERTGLGANTAFSGVVLLDSDGTQIGNAKTLNSNNQANVGTDFVIPAGTSKTVTIAGNMDSDLTSESGQTLSLSVVAVNTSATVSGSLPIKGASHTANDTLSIGSVTTNLGIDDPNTDADKDIGTTGYIFQSIRVTAGSAEDVRLRNIRWNQTGSASKDDLANIVVVVDGVEYPTTVSADGKTYSANFGGGIVIQQGFSKEVSIKGDILSGPSRTVVFDIDDATDIYATGETFGYGIVPTAGSTSSAVTTSSQFTTGTPFFDGAHVTISAGSVSTVSKLNSVQAQNIAVNAANQPLGGFSVDIKGEPISVQQMVFHLLATGNSVDDITNVTLVDQNGSVVAGPVDGVVTSGAGGKVTFSDTVTFPIGVTELTLKGQLNTNFVNDDTIQASTTPSSDWTNVTGQVTGNTITISASEVTANTMTVKTATTTITVASAPASQNVVAGSSNFTFANYQFDASASGEDVRFTTLSLNIETDTNKTNNYPNNCFVYDGSTKLNSTAVSPTSDGNKTFTLSTALVVPKGTVKTVALKCDVPASTTADSEIEWKLDGDATNQGIGLGSAQTFTATTNDSANNQNKMTVKTGGTLTVEKDSTSPSYAVVAAGSTDVTVGALKFRATNEAVDVDQVALQLTNTASSSASDVVRVTLWDGATQVGEGLFTAGNTHATTSLTGNFRVPADGEKTMTIKADLASIGTSQIGDSGALIAIDYDGDNSSATEGTGVDSGTSVSSSSTSDTAVSGVRMFRSLPTFTKLALPSNTLTGGDQALYRFSVTADSAGSIGIGQFTVRVATSSATVTDLNIYGYTDSGFSTPISGVSSGGALLATADDLSGWTGSTFDIEVEPSNGSFTAVQVPAGSTRYFEVRASVTDDGSDAQVTTQLQGDSEYFATDSDAPFTDTHTAIDADADDDFIWSPNSTSTTDAKADNDWTNGYGLVGLPSGNMTSSSITD